MSKTILTIQIKDAIHAVISFMITECLILVYFAIYTLV